MPNRIIRYLLSCFRTIFKQNIKSEGGRIYYNKNVKLRLDKTATIRLKGNLILDGDGFGEKSLLEMKQNSQIYVDGNFLFFTNASIHLEENATIFLGNNSYINADCHIHCKEKIHIGENCVISLHFVALDSNWHKMRGTDGTAPIVIGDHVWIGSNVIICGGGITIGNDSVIAAGAVVTEDIPPNCLAGGVPAKVIRENINWE